jgi:subtilase family serine protease
VRLNQKSITVGEEVYIKAAFTTQSLPKHASYQIAYTVNGLTQESVAITSGAGQSGTHSWNHRVGYFLASPGTNQVSVTIVPDSSAEQKTYTYNTKKSTFTAAAAAGGRLSYTVAQIRAAYGINNIPDFGSATADGSGQKIALVEVGNDPNLLTDLDGFDKAMDLTTTSKTLYQQYGAAASFVKVFNQSGMDITAHIAQSGVDGVPAQGSDGNGEVSLDIDWAHAIAPGAKIDVIEVNPGSNGSSGEPNVIAGNAIAASLPGVSVVSYSGSIPESSSDATYDSSVFVTSAGHKGVTFLASSGDFGSNVYPSGSTTLLGRYPAQSPNVVAVGATQLQIDNNAYASETGWSFPAPTDIVKNGSSSYSQTGSWTSHSGGYSGTYTTAAGGSSSSAVWTIPVTAANEGHGNGTELSATWIAGGLHATNATYTIYNGNQQTGTVLGTVVVNQVNALVGTVVGSSQFQELGVFFATLKNGTGTLTVVLSANSANGKVIADAIGSAPDSATTGGPSTLETEPAYQLPFQSTGFRTTPDVSFDGSPGSGVTVFRNGSLTYGIGGTSLSSPCWAGLIAIVNQGRVAAGGSTLNSPSDPTQALEALYSLPSSDFHDITSGYNGFSAGPGYDYVTGRGSPIANLLVPALVSYGQADPLVVLTQPRTKVTVSRSFRLSVAVDAAGRRVTSTNMPFTTEELRSHRPARW